MCFPSLSMACGVPVAMDDPAFALTFPPYEKKKRKNFPLNSTTPHRTTPHHTPPPHHHHCHHATTPPHRHRHHRHHYHTAITTTVPPSPIMHPRQRRRLIVACLMYVIRATFSDVARAPNSADAQNGVERGPARDPDESKMAVCTWYKSNVTSAMAEDLARVVEPDTLLVDCSVSGPPPSCLPWALPCPHCASPLTPSPDVAALLISKRVFGDLAL